LNDDLGLRAPALALVEALSGIATPDAPRQRHQVSFAGWLAAQQALAAFIVIWMRTWDLTPGEEIATDPRVRLAQVHLASNARIDHVPYDDLATTTGLGRVQLDRLFKQQLGRSPKAELDRLCLERVLRRLADRSRSLKGIASELGFTDTSHLCRWFRRLSGVSPEQHRRSAAL
jgi:transcriptional regulator GlxA family with amidase domain